MTISAIHFEAKKYSLRQAKDGVVVSFVVHPNDVRPELLSAPIGEHYIVALAPYTEEEPVAVVAKKPPAADAKPKERRPFHSLPRSQQAALACNDERFRQWARDVAGLGQRADDPDAVASWVRADCNVVSRRELDTNDHAAIRWDNLHSRYLRETGQQTERRG